MYSSFVTFINRDSDGSRLLKICDHDFKAHSYDWYIDDTIKLTEYWKPLQITYQSILHLRTWIRENYQHGHEILYKRIRSMQGCGRWEERIIRAEYASTREEYIESRDSSLKINRNVFSINSS